MSLEPLVTEVQQLLARADERIRRAEQGYAEGSDAEKVEAAGQLVFLKRQKAELESRMAELEGMPGRSGAVRQWLKEDWMLLMHRLDAFIDGR